MKFRTGIGQDSHRFLSNGTEKKCIIAGLVFEDAPGMDADSDGDVVFHAICNAITSLTHVPILGKLAIDLCHKQGITDSRVYLEEALATLGEQKIEHIALTIEGKRPKFQKRSLDIRQSVAEVVKLEEDQVGITFTSGDGLTSFGKGEGLMCYAVVTTFQ
ncbi:2-C-methyl-D-erythritol 2,4-cyclodiphosphate synthase [Simkania sp.]|uniref:2-C-methyl-D-erythritol 2,4-cyclodiphosphate synthase n=1 Tax=Simkania sp. TaxID=34094 RepID=UPI003B516779